MGAYELNYYEEMKKAEAGDLDAMFAVASYIVWGDMTSPVEPEAVERAVRYYTANANEGDTDSMLDLGAMYRSGRGVEKNDETALSWYMKAAEAGGHNACRCIGNFYKYDELDDGTPVPTADLERLKKAFEWYEKGAENEEENSLYELGDFYRYGVVVEKDEEKAFSLYEEACRIIVDYVLTDTDSLNDSYSDVCLRLAECYHYGIGTEPDLEEAVYYIKIAKAEAQRRYNNGDMWGGCPLPRIKKEWQKIMQEADT